MTDNEIIKALECCIKNDIAQCKICAYDKFEQGCRRKLNPDILDLINRQQADIERLQNFLDMSRKVSLARRDQNIRKDELMIKMSAELKTAKSEVIKEFAERLKEQTSTYEVCRRSVKFVAVYNIDNLVKEMTEVEK